MASYIDSPWAPDIELGVSRHPVVIADIHRVSAEVDRVRGQRGGEVARGYLDRPEPMASRQSLVSMASRTCGSLALPA